MRQPLIYLAHPVRADDKFTTKQNIARAKQFLLALMQRGLHVVAPWLPIVELLDDTNPAHRELGMAINLNTVERADILLWTGHKVSGGMGDEGNAYLGVPGARLVLDATGMEPDAAAAAVVEIVPQVLRQMIRMRAEPLIVPAKGLPPT